MKRVNRSSPLGADPAEDEPRRRLRAHLRAVGLLLLGPVLALSLAHLVLRDNDGYWRIFSTLQSGHPLEVQARLRQYEPGDAEIALLGSSVALIDVHEVLLGQELDGRRVVNLGIKTAPLCVTAMLLPEVVRLQPELALLVVGPDGLKSDEPLPHPATWSWGLPYDPVLAAEIYGASSLAWEWSFHLDQLLGWSNVLWSHRAVLRQWYQKARHNRSPQHPRNFPRMSRGVLKQRLQRLRYQTAELELDGTGPNAGALRVMARKLRASGIRLVVCPAPVDPRVYDRIFHPELEALLDRMAVECGFDRIRSRDLGEYTGSDFRDGNHLLPEGQSRFTRAVARQLRPLFQGDERALQ